MVNIWLDDERDPNDPVIQELFGSERGMIWVKTTHAAINWLKTRTVAWISLDHDLGTTTTGYDVAKWIEERAHSGELPRLTWTVHSANVAGARSIRTALQNADRFWSRHEHDHAAEIE
ncbi:MAG: cyclic-phosphate processing receiver domain-containing protein [Planctomycetaceae bacterium]